jgi:hypothetical protein
VSATRALAWAAATLGMNAPPIYLAPERDEGMVVVPALPPALRVGSRMLRGQSAIQLAFHCGRALSWFRSEHFVCTLVPGYPEILHALNQLEQQPGTVFSFGGEARLLRGPEHLASLQDRPERNILCSAALFAHRPHRARPRLRRHRAGPG